MQCWLDTGQLCHSPTARGRPKGTSCSWVRGPVGSACPSNMQSLPEGSHYRCKPLYTLSPSLLFVLHWEVTGHSFVHRLSKGVTVVPSPTLPWRCRGIPTAGAPQGNSSVEEQTYRSHGPLLYWTHEELQANTLRDDAQQRLSPHDTQACLRKIGCFGGGF